MTNYSLICSISSLFEYNCHFSTSIVNLYAINELLESNYESEHGKSTTHQIKKKLPIQYSNCIFNDLLFTSQCDKKTILLNPHEIEFCVWYNSCLNSQNVIKIANRQSCCNDSFWMTNYNYNNNNEYKWIQRCDCNCGKNCLNEHNHDDDKIFVTYKTILENINLKNYHFTDVDNHSSKVIFSIHFHTFDEPSLCNNNTIYKSIEESFGNFINSINDIIEQFRKSNKKIIIQIYTKNITNELKKFILKHDLNPYIYLNQHFYLI